MKLSSELFYEFVMNYLKKYTRCVVNMKPDNNSLLNRNTEYTILKSTNIAQGDTDLYLFFPIFFLFFL